MSASLPVLAGLALLGLIGGIGITAVGPGGVLPTIGLFLLTDLSPAGVAGTSIATHVATGLLGTWVYARSGQLRAPETRRTALLLGAAALAGTPLGVLLNTVLSGPVFAYLLAGAVATTGALVWVREHRSSPRPNDGHLSAPVSLTVGLTVSVAAGLFGLGGPMLSVPLLVVLGVAVLPALAVAQAQSIVIAVIGTAAYVTHGSVDWVLAVLVGVPELVGVVIGWRIAHALPERQLKYGLAATLIVLAPYLAFQG